MYWISILPFSLGRVITHLAGVFFSFLFVSLSLSLSLSLFLSLSVCPYLSASFWLIIHDLSYSAFLSFVTLSLLPLYLSAFLLPSLSLSHTPSFLCYLFISQYVSPFVSWLHLNRDDVKPFTKNAEHVVEFMWCGDDKTINYFSIGSHSFLRSSAFFCTGCVVFLFFLPQYPVPSTFEAKSFPFWL